MTAANMSLVANAESLPSVGPEDEDDETSGAAMPSFNLH